MALGLLIVVGSVPTASPAQALVRPHGTGSPKHTTFAFRPWLSADGRFVAFDSDAPLVPGGMRGVRDVYVEDRTTGALERVSVASDGTPGDGPSMRPTISADGRYVAFWSSATNLVPGDTNGVADCFVHDRLTGQTTRVSVASDGTQSNGVSARPVISGDGQLVAFESAATNLVPQSLLGAGHSKGLRDVYVHNLKTGRTIQVSVGSDGTPAKGDSVRPSISQDGRYVAFDSDAALVPGKTNRATDVFVHDLTTGQTTRISVASDGTQAKRGGSFEPSISGDGRFVAFWSNAKLVAGATNGKSVFVHDRTTGATTRISVASDATGGNGDSSRPAITPDGRYVTFWSYATNLAPGDTHGVVNIFVHDRTTGATTRVSVASDGTQSNGDSFAPTISGDGRITAFDSKATNLVPNDPDPNRGTDVYVHDAATGQTTRISASR